MLEQNLLQSLVTVAPLLPKIFNEDVGIAVTDRKNFLTYIPGKRLDFRVKPGDPIQDPVMQHTLQTGERCEDLVSAETFGIPFKAIVVPIHEHNQLVGSLGIALSTKTQTKVQEITNHLADTMNQIAASSQEISASAENAASRTEMMSTEAAKVSEYIDNTNNILQIVRYVADQTRLLGLNAAIEAARAGELGRGFSVVAEEVRKLADKSQESVQEVYTILQNLEESTNLLVNFIGEINAMAQSQAAASEEVAASTSDTAVVLEDLATLAKKL